MEIYGVRIRNCDLSSGKPIGCYSTLYRARCVIRTQREFERLASRLEKEENQVMRTIDRNTRCEVVGIYPLKKEAKDLSQRVLYDLITWNKKMIIDNKNLRWSRR